MRQRAPLLLLFGSALAFLASLYLPWREIRGLLVTPNDGWSAGAGAMAGVFALALAASAAAALARPGLASRMPLGRLALGMGYFGLAAFLELVRGTASLRPSGPVPTHSSYGVYVALGAVVAAQLCAAALRWHPVLPRLSATDAASAALGAGVLAAFLLPWQETAVSLGSFEHLGIDFPSSALAAVALWLAGSLHRREAAPGNHLALAVVVAVLVGGAFSSGSSYPVQRYGAWVGLGLALALVAVTAFGAREWRPAMPFRANAATTLLSVLLVASLFLPWVEYGAEDGHSLTVVGWAGPWGSIGGSLALMAIAMAAMRRSEVYLPELVAAVAVSTTTMGFEVTGVPAHLRYGAYVGFVAAGLLTLLRLRRRPSAHHGRLDMQIVAVAACLAYLGIALVPMWFELSFRINRWTPDKTFWLTVAGTLLALRLLASWLRRPAGPGLVLIPLGLLTLVSLDLVRWRAQGMGWGGVTVVLLSLVLAVLGWIERGGDPRRFRLPESLRLDRLPETES